MIYSGLYVALGMISEKNLIKSVDKPVSWVPFPLQPGPAWRRRKRVRRPKFESGRRTQFPLPSPLSFPANSKHSSPVFPSAFRMCKK